MTRKNVILTATRWTEMRGTRLKVGWNIGERCADCRHAKRSQWSSCASCQIK
jgi:hypothetical protein